MAGQKRRKSINFDLDTAALRSLFGEPGRRKAYSDVGRFLKKNGFEHRQGSGYQSMGALTEAEINDIVVDLYETLPWLLDVVQKLDVTNIGVNYDMHTVAKRQVESKHATKKKQHFNIV